MEIRQAIQAHIDAEERGDVQGMIRAVNQMDSWVRERGGPWADLQSDADLRAWCLEEAGD